MSKHVKTARGITCAANTSTTVHNRRWPPWWSCPTRTETLDGRLPPLKNMLTKVQHGWSTFGDPKVRPAEIEVVAHFPSFTRLSTKITIPGDFNKVSEQLWSHTGITDEACLCVIKLKMGELEVLKDLDVRVANHEIAMLLSPALFQWPVLSTLDTSPFHHPNAQNHTVFCSKTTHHIYYTRSSEQLCHNQS